MKLLGDQVRQPRRRPSPHGGTTVAGFLPVEMRDKHVFALDPLTRGENAPPHHDPFDRMLIAQAKTENLSFLTHDAILPYYNEPCIVQV